MSSQEHARPASPPEVGDRLHGDAFSGDPFPTWADLRGQCPVGHDEVDDVYLLTRHADVRWGFLGGPPLSSRIYRKTLGQVFGPNLLQVEGEEHMRRRRLVAPLLIGRRLRDYVPVIEQVAEQVVADFAGRGEVEIVAEVGHRVPGAVILAIMGLPHEDQPMLFEWYEAMMAGLWDDPDLRERGRQAHRAFAEYLEPIAQQRRDDPGDDLVSRLVTSALEPEEIPSFASLLLTAGGETTDKAIGNLWFNLLSHHDALAAVQADPDLLDAAFTETLRLSPSLAYLGREALEDVDVGGVTIPAGATVRLGVAAANHDDRAFAEPTEFRLDRDDLFLQRERRNAPSGDGRSSHLAFGAGEHFCLGYELARLEVVTVSRRMLAVMRDPELTEPVERILDGPSLVVPRLPVRFTPAAT